MLQLDVMALLNGEIKPVSKYGSASTTKWRTNREWIAGYTTEKITNSSGGKYDGKFACLVWKPIKQNGKVIRWEIVYFRAFNLRKTAKATALKHYYRHHKA
jgi:hypothetical protein